MIQITPLSEEHLPEAAVLFTQKLANLRRTVPFVPDRMEDPVLVAQMLSGRTSLAALDGERLVGYLAWFLVEHFRGATRLGAYVPEWGHAVQDGEEHRIYPRLYRAASRLWSQADCQVHAITLLDSDHAAESAWYWSGFGLAVIDAIRPMRPLDQPVSTTLLIRRATAADLETLAALDIEHRQHYTKPPIFMAQRQPNGVAEWDEFISRPLNQVWLALDGKQAVGFMVFNASDYDTVEILNVENLIGISGAYLKPEYRGQKAGSALLEAALRDYAADRLKICAVDFESFNPEAAAFWPKHFNPVCHSLMRIPET